MNDMHKGSVSQALRALAGLVPISAALIFDATVSWISAALVKARCDECAHRIPQRQAKMLIVHFHAAPRVNGYRAWGFCSDACRARWFAAGSTQDFHPVVDAWTVYDPVPFTSADGEVQVSVIHDDGPGRGAPGVALNDAQGNRKITVDNGRLVAQVLLASPQAVNAWWREPVAADERQAA